MAGSVSPLQSLESFFLDRMKAKILDALKLEEKGHQDNR